MPVGDAAYNRRDLQSSSHHVLYTEADLYCGSDSSAHCIGTQGLQHPRAMVKACVYSSSAAAHNCPDLQPPSHTAHQLRADALTVQAWAAACCGSRQIAPTGIAAGGP